MILYNYQKAPNPRRVRIFLAEKKINIEIKDLDLMSGENLKSDFLKLNPTGTVPILLTDDGTVISESIAICRYLEEKYPDPLLMGKDPLEKAKIEMWQRIIEFKGIFPAGEAFRNKVQGFKNRAVAGPIKIKQIPELIERGEILLEHFFTLINSHLLENEYFAGKNFSIADISAYIAVDFASWTKVTPNEKFSSLHEWLKRIKSRESMHA